MRSFVLFFSVLFAGTAMAVEPTSNVEMEPTSNVDKFFYHSYKLFHSLRCTVSSCANDTATPDGADGADGNPLKKRLYPSEQEMTTPSLLLQLPRDQVHMFKAGQNTANEMADSYMNLCGQWSAGVKDAAPTVKASSTVFHGGMAVVPVLLVAVLIGFLLLALLWQHRKMEQMLQRQDRQLSAKDQEAVAYLRAGEWIHHAISCLTPEEQDCIMQYDHNTRVYTLDQGFRLFFAQQIVKQGFKPELTIITEQNKPSQELVESVLHAVVAKLKKLKPGCRVGHKLQKSSVLLAWKNAVQQSQRNA